MDKPPPISCNFNEAKTALDRRVVTKHTLKQVICDTTVMPKKIAYPTDSRLYYKALVRLVRMAKKRKVPLRQSYSRLSKHALVKAHRYVHARQMKRAKREMKKLKTWLGRVYREVDRYVKTPLLTPEFEDILDLISRLLEQKRDSKNKIYSIHEPNVACIAKGKANIKYEFGCKVSLVVTHKEGLVLSSEALPGTPYDGHTLADALKDAESTHRVPIYSLC